MRIRIIHVWSLAAISCLVAFFMSFSREPVGALIFTALYLILLVCTKWADE